MKKIVLQIAAIMCLFCYAGCEKLQMEKQLEGMWLIQNFKNKTGKKYDELHIVNTIIFEDNGLVTLPVFVHEPYDHNEGRWSIVKSDNYYEIFIESSNEVFKGYFKIVKIEDIEYEGHTITELQLESKNCFF